MTQTLERKPSVRALHSALDESVERLKYSVAGDVVARERAWAVSVSEAARDVAAALGRYQTVKQSEPAPLTETDNIRPGLLRRWTELTKEYDQLVRESYCLALDAENAVRAFEPVGGILQTGTIAPSSSSAATVPVFGHIRLSAEDILRRLDQYRAEEAALLLESVTTDIGVGD